MKVRLVTAGEPILHLCFFETGIASTVVRNDRSKSIERFLLAGKVLPAAGFVGCRNDPGETAMCVGGRRHHDFSCGNQA